MAKTTLALSVVLALVALGGCAKEEDLKDNLSEAVQAHELEHSWVEIGCQSTVSALAQVGVTTKNTYRFHGDDVEFTQNLYSDANCQQLAASVQYLGQFDKKDEISPHSNTYQLNLRYVAVFVAPKSDSGRDFLNATAFCGKSDWVTNQAADLTGSANLAFCPLDDLPRALYDIYLVSGDHLFLGKGDKTDPNHRPTELDSNDPYLQF